MAKFFSFFKNSLYGNNNMQNIYSYIHFFLIESNLPYLCLIDPSLNMLEHLKYVC